MADLKLTELDPAGVALDGSALVYIVAGGVSYQTTVAELVALATPTAADVVGLSEAVDDRVAALLVAGAGITLTYDDTAGTLTIARSVAAPVTVTYGASTTVNVSGRPDSQVHRMTLTGNLALDFTGGTDGQKVWVELTQDGTGGRTVTLGAGVAYGTDITSFTATTTASKKDILGFIYSSAASKYLLVAVAKGY